MFLPGTFRRVPGGQRGEGGGEETEKSRHREVKKFDYMTRKLLKWTMTQSHILNLLTCPFTDETISHL